MATDPQENPTREEQVEQRSLSTTLIQTAEMLGASAVVGTTTGVAGALTHHWLQGDKAAEDGPATPHVELPPGVHVDDD